MNIKKVILFILIIVLIKNGKSIERGGFTFTAFRSVEIIKHLMFTILFNMLSFFPDDDDPKMIISL